MATVDLGGAGADGSTGSIVYVDTASDLPAAVAGVRTLVDGTVYYFRQSVDLGADRLTADANSFITLRAPSRFAITLQTTHASALIAFTGGIHVEEVKLLNDAGPVFDITTGGGHSINIESGFVTNAGTDTFTGVGGNLIIKLATWRNCTGGIEVDGAWAACLLDTVGFAGADAAMTYFTAAAGTTFAVVGINNCSLLRTAAGQTALDIDSGIAPTYGAEVTGCSFFGLGTAVTGITTASIGWVFTANPGLQSSAFVGAMSFTGNGTATTIAAVDTWTTIAHTPAWSLDAASERFSIDGEALQYDGIQTRRMAVTVFATIEAAANNKDLEMRVLKNGTAVAASVFLLGYRATPKSASKGFLVEMATGDELTWQIQNTTDAVDATMLELSVMAAAVD